MSGVAAIRAVPLPHATSPGKYYLPAFNIVATVPTLPAACALEQGLLELIQYRGNSVACFNLAMGRPVDDSSDPLQSGDERNCCVVAVATRAQIYASVMLGRGAVDVRELLRLAAATEPPLEPWEAAYVEASAAFLEYHYEECTARCLANLEKNPFDAFSARLLLITTFLGSDHSALCDGFTAVTSACENAIRQQDSGTWSGSRHTLHLALPYWMSWSAFGFEETRRDVVAAERLSRRAISLTVENNAAYFPTRNPLVDQLNAVGALRAAAPNFGFTCVFGVHVLLHCFDARGDPQGALDALSAIDDSLWQEAVHLAHHLWWHVAVFKLETCNVDGAITAFTTFLGHPDACDPYQLADTTAFAWRLYTVVNYFAAAGADAHGNPWLKADLSSIAPIVKTVSGHWALYDAQKLSKAPFFVCHRALTDVMAASVTTSGEMRLWPTCVRTIRMIEPEPPEESSLTVRLSPAYRRKIMCRRLYATAEHFSIGVEDGAREGLLCFAGLVDQLSEPAGPSLHDRVMRATQPMGGSLAQMRLLSFPMLLLLALFRRPGSRLAMKQLAVQQPQCPLLVSAAAAAERFVSASY